MAIAKHLDLLKHGTETWNAWRTKNEHVKPDLTGANLRGCYLSWINFANSNLEGADLAFAYLRYADFTNSNLTMASLGSAHLEGAKFRGANLNGASLRSAHLRGSILGVDSNRGNYRNQNLVQRIYGGTGFNEAQITNIDLSYASFHHTKLHDIDLSGALLVCANFTAADLTSANFTSAELYRTVFADTNLTNAVGLETCRHIGPSFIDHRTLAKSGNLPIQFLRGCGLPDLVINHLSVLRGDPIQFYTCFLSYSSEDEAFAKRLHADLQDNGVRCWFAPHDLDLGEKIGSTIDSEIRVRDKVILILSAHSIDSSWVRREVDQALAEEKVRNRTVLIPLRLDDEVLYEQTGWAKRIARRKIGDFRRWTDPDHYELAFNQLMLNLKTQGIEVP